MTAVLITSDFGRSEFDRAMNGAFSAEKVEVLEPFDFNLEKLSHLPLYILSNIGGNDQDMAECVNALYDPSHFSEGAREDLLKQFRSIQFLEKRVRALSDYREKSIAIELKNIPMSRDTLRPLIRLFKFFTKDNPKIILFTQLEVDNIGDTIKNYFDEILS